jgi:hypothetical protein
MVLELDEREKMILKKALKDEEEELKDVRLRTDKEELRVAIHDDEVVIEKLLKKVA